VRTDPIKVLLAGGGTGGHVIPAIALAEELVSRGCTVSFVGTRGRLEERLVPEAGFNIEYIKVRPLTGRNVVHKALGLMAVPAALLRAARLIRRARPDVVMGVGGYVAGPVVLAAALMRIPTALLEQNATLGLSNRLLARWVDRAFVSYPELLSAFPETVGMHTGNPVKADIVAASRNRSRQSEEARIRVLVMGGSQGAKAIDERVPKALLDAGAQGKVRVLHQCGEHNEAEVTAAYETAGIDATVVPFISDTASVFSDTDLVISRSGATTISELTVMGLPAVLLPYPHHTDRQQEKNAAPMQRAGAAIVLNEQQTGVAEMAAAIESFIENRNKLEKAAIASSSLGRGNAAIAITDALIDLAGRA
jgi:UDP-N-acetylglucosamine--N-acetylmuramyl-(pentapeptide) pyrophosphoryl-undecaprenol N-acetylglucosamine transferase